jgi:CheY-like chemotaxis protein
MLRTECVSIRILIADDNASLRTAMRQVLEGVGRWEIIEAENGIDAVVKAQELRPQLVILDLAMPVMDGLTASREIARLLPGVPILLHTLYSSPQVEWEAGKSGVLRVVPKTQISALVSAVQDALHAAAESCGKTIEAERSAKLAGLRRTEDRVRGLCMRLVTAKDEKLLEGTLAELREALHQHVENFRARLGEYPAMPERRMRTILPAENTGSARRLQ